MSTHIAAVSVLVRDYDKAIAWFVDKLGFALAEDTALAPSRARISANPCNFG